MACSPEKITTTDVITADHAVLIPPVPGASLMSYVEAVATVIGSCHIHSVYEDTEFMKIYLNDKKLVDFLVNTGVSVLGRRVNVDYAIPRADKVILENVDPILPDSILMRFLCCFGSPISTIIHEKIASNFEYSHIECGTRKIYMNLNNDKKPPSKVSLTYLEVPYRFDMSVERYEKRVHEVDSSTTEQTNEDEIADDSQEIESVSSLKPNIEEIVLNEDASKRRRSSTKKTPTPAQVAYRNRGKSKAPETSVTYAARKIKSRAAKGWYKNKIRKAKNVSTDRAEVKKLVGKVATPKGGRRSRGGISRGRGRGYSKNSLSNDVSILNIGSSPIVEASSAETNMEVGVTSPKSSTPKNINAHSLIQFPLSTEELKKLLFQTRCHRAPLQVALEFLNRRNVPNATKELMKQLLEYHNMIKVQSLRIRIRRLVKSLESAIKEKAAA